MRGRGATCVFFTHSHQRKKRMAEKATPAPSCTQLLLSAAAASCVVIFAVGAFWCAQIMERITHKDDTIYVRVQGP